MIRVNNLHPSVFLINFGLAWPFHNPAMYLHIPYSKNHQPIGTVPFMSINSQQGYSQSHHDDLESLAYAIIHSACSNLPWRSFSTNCVLKKESITPEELCEGLPVHFCEFISHVCSLGFNEKPDYQSLHSILLKCAAAKTDVISSDWV
jgi:serine/threonine protein kinase